MKFSKWCFLFRGNGKLNDPSWLFMDVKIEVYQYELNGTYSAYEMVVHEIDQDVVQVFYHDDPKAILYPVSKMCIAPITYRIKDALYGVGENIEVYYRVDDESPWGWWSATILEIKEDTYKVQYAGTKEQDEVSKIDVRKAIFQP